jgi:signal peptidase II
MALSRLSQLYWLLLSVAVVIADQLSKYIITEALNFHEVVPFIPFLNITWTHNTGAAFGFLNDAGGLQQWLFAIVAISMTLVMTIWLYRLPSSDRWTACALALIIGGALGNLWDRLVLGYVVDFIDFYIRDWHFATFNIADMAICIGAGILVLLTFRKEQ